MTTVIVKTTVKPLGVEFKQGVYVPPPSGGDTDIATLIAGETLSALKLVYDNGNLVYAIDNMDTEDKIDRLLGLTITAANMGGNIAVRLRGFVEDSGWNWTRGRIFLGSNGSLTQVPPDDGASLLVAVAVSPTKIFLKLSEAVFM